LPPRYPPKGASEDPLKDDLVYRYRYPTMVNGFVSHRRNPESQRAIARDTTQRIRYTAPTCFKLLKEVFGESLPRKHSYTELQTSRIAMDANPQPPSSTICSRTGCIGGTRRRTTRTWISNHGPGAISLLLNFTTYAFESYLPPCLPQPTSPLLRNQPGVLSSCASLLRLLQL
jgi:hypothetical protein